MPSGLHRMRIRPVIALIVPGIVVIGGAAARTGALS